MTWRIYYISKYASKSVNLTRSSIRSSSSSLSIFLLPFFLFFWEEQTNKCESVEHNLQFFSEMMARDVALATKRTRKLTFFLAVLQLHFIPCTRGLVEIIWLAPNATSCCVFRAGMRHVIPIQSGLIAYTPCVCVVFATSRICHSNG